MLSATFIVQLCIFKECLLSQSSTTGFWSRRSTESLKPCMSTWKPHIVSLLQTSANHPLTSWNCFLDPKRHEQKHTNIYKNMFSLTLANCCQVKIFDHQPDRKSTQTLPKFDVHRSCKNEGSESTCRGLRALLCIAGSCNMQPESCTPNTWWFTTVQNSIRKRMQMQPVGSQLYPALYP